MVGDYILYMKNIFSADKTFYSPCPSLEGTKDALCKRSRLVRTGRTACTNIVVMEMHFARARGAKHFTFANEATNPLAKLEAR